MPMRHADLSVAPKRILIIKLRHHGDMLLTTPVINNLRHHYPDCEIDILLYKETEAILRAHPAISVIHAIDRAWKKQGFVFHLKQELGLIKAIRRRRYDIVINLADQWRSAIITWASGAPCRIGYAFSKRRSAVWRQAHTHLVPTDNFGQLHTVEQNLAILAPLNLAIDNDRTSMHYSPSDDRVGREKLAAAGVTGAYIVIQPTSRWRYKCWDDAKVAALIDGLGEYNLSIVLTAAPDKKERQMIDHIQSLSIGSDAVSLAGELTLPQLAAVIDHARLFIGVDSAPMHMAAALDTPCIALFGPTKLQHWRPWNENSTVIWAGDFAALPRPDTIDTNTHERYLSAIPVESVLQAAKSYLT
ncbi:putative lipopolysaccharide heptosyltransferase III [Biostraticola tofi]|uniref:Lipopolysaccharide heptosyltransferase 3 n=1 Tax=Biostraticola tofi TaxID=466109 RepID=A0A4R3YMQ2_9GAMM|nr:heptosyltransferase-3 [Biostraticola tofi]